MKDALVVLGILFILNFCSCSLSSYSCYSSGSRKSSRSEKFVIRPKNNNRQQHKYK